MTTSTLKCVLRGLTAAFAAASIAGYTSPCQSAPTAQPALPLPNQQGLLWAASTNTVWLGSGQRHLNCHFTTMPIAVGSLPERPFKVVGTAAIRNAHIETPRPRHRDIVTVSFAYLRPAGLSGPDTQTLSLLSASGKVIGRIMLRTMQYRAAP